MNESKLQIAPWKEELEKKPDYQSPEYQAQVRKAWDKAGSRDDFFAGIACARQSSLATREGSK